MRCAKLPRLPLASSRQGLTVKKKKVMDAKVGNKGGRPPKAAFKKRGCPVTLRFTEAEYSIVKAKAAEVGLKLVDYLRESSLHALVRTSVTPQDIAAIKVLSTEIRNIGINLNTLARKANAGMARDYGKDIQKVLDSLRDILDRFTQKMLNNGWKN